MTLRDDIANLPLSVKDKDEGHNSHHMVLHKAVQDHDARLDSAVQGNDPRLSDARPPTDSSVGTAKIADLAVTGAKIADATINGGQKLVDSSVSSSKLGTNAVATAKIADKAVTAAKIADATITSSKLDAALQAEVGKAGTAVQPAALTTKADLVGGTIPQAQLPAIAVTEFLGAVATQAAMLALIGQRGDWCTRTDRGTDFQLIAEPPTVLANWRERTYPASPVSSVAGRTGPVTLSVADVSGAVADTDARLTNSRTPLGTVQATWNAGTQNSANYGLTPAELRAATAVAIAAIDPKSSIGGVSIVLGNDVALYNTRTPTPGTVPYDITYSAQTGMRVLGYGDVPAGIKLTRAVTFSEMTVHCETADASGNLVVTLNKNGTAVSGASVTIAAANQVAGATVTGSWAFAKGDILRINVTGVGTTPGKGLVVDLLGMA